MKPKKFFKNKLRVQKIKAPRDIRRVSSYRNSCFVLGASFICRYLKQCDRSNP